MANMMDVFIVFFITLGPLKVIPVFYMLTQHAEPKAVRRLALLSTLDATVITFVIAVVFSAVMTRWQISPEAMRIAGGILLFVISLRAITQFELVEASPEMHPAGNPSAGTAPRVHWFGKPVLSPLAIPVIITPVGVVAILLIMSLTVGSPHVISGIFLLLLFVMALNLAAMVWARPIMRYVKLPVLQIVGWVMQILMSALAVQVVLVAMRQLKALP